jgi:predicted SnoaL-like aldol condensation-catalyzing enzyme
MDTARNKDVARRLYALINEGRVEQVADLISPDYQEHDPLPGQGSGREGAVDRFSMITTALAPHFTVEDPWEMAWAPGRAAGSRSVLTRE